jgi:hypothetical protein
MFIAIDVGRSSVKVAYTASSWRDVGSFVVTSQVATSFSNFAKPDSALVNSYSDDEVSQIEVKETQGDWNADLSNFFMFGKQARKQGSSASAFSEGTQFHKFGVAIILFVVSKVLREHGVWDKSLHPKLVDDQVSLAINLTYSNNESVSFYSKSLKGRHVIGLGEVVGGRVASVDVGFDIKDLYCFQQGYAAIFNFIGSPEFALVQGGKGVIVDVGRYTVDFSKVDELTLVGGFSMDYGTRHLITELQGLFSAGGIKLSLEEIELALADHSKTFSNVHGKFIKPWEVLQGLGSLDKYYGEIKIGVSNFVGEERVDYIILCGGGTYLIRDRFMQDFKATLLEVDYLMANAFGMLKMLSAGSYNET